MKHPALAAATAGIALLALTACVASSTSGVQVVGDNIARLEQGDTMVVHKGGKGARTWHITYDGDSTVTFDCQQWLCTDQSGTLGAVGQRVKVDNPGIMNGDFYVTRRDDEAVSVEWPWGLGIQLP